MRGGDVPRARSPNREKAYELWKASDKSRGAIKRISDDLGVSEALVRKWKNQDGWDSKEDMVTLPNKRKTNGNVTIQKGAPAGNQNAKGHGAPRRNRNAMTHGAYCQIFSDALSPEEATIFDTMDYRSIYTIKQEIGLLTIRERRLMQRIWSLQKRDPDPYLDSGAKRELKISGNIIKGDRQEQTEIKTLGVLSTIQMYETELTRVQRAKGAYIKLLYEIIGDNEEEALQSAVDFVGALEKSAQMIELGGTENEPEKEDGNGTI